MNSKEFKIPYSNTKTKKDAEGRLCEKNQPFIINIVRLNQILFTTQHKKQQKKYINVLHKIFRCSIEKKTYFQVLKKFFSISIIKKM